MSVHKAGQPRNKLKKLVCKGVEGENESHKGEVIKYEEEQMKGERNCVEPEGSEGEGESWSQCKRMKAGRE